MESNKTTRRVTKVRKPVTSVEITRESQTNADKVLVVLPYNAKGAQGREIEFAVAGWRKHFKEDYLIVVVGDEKPSVCDTGSDIMFIESPKVEHSEGNYRQHLDYVSCFKKVRAAFPESKGFVFTADDGYAVHNFDLADVKVLKIDAVEMGGNADSYNGWERDQARTKAKLLEEGYPVKCYTTHIPQWYDWDKLEALWEKYDMEHTSYVFENLYFNIYYGDRLTVTLDFFTDIYRCPILRSNPNWAQLPEMLKTKIWIFNTVNGYSERLEEELAKYYGI